MKPRILILDNLEEQIQLFTQILQTANYKVIITNNDWELLDLIESEYPDIVLISNSLVDKDIYLICKKIKLLELGENIEVNKTSIKEFKEMTERLIKRSHNLKMKIVNILFEGTIYQLFSSKVKTLL